MSAVLASVLTAAAMLTLGAQASPPAVEAIVVAHGDTEKAEPRNRGGLGPPAWAPAGGQGAHRAEAAQSWKDQWHALTPAQKTRQMAALARAHEDGMRKWRQCVRAAGTERATRGSCQKPLPPGLAKKQS